MTVVPFPAAEALIVRLLRLNKLARVVNDDIRAIAGGGEVLQQVAVEVKLGVGDVHGEARVEQ